DLENLKKERLLNPAEGMEHMVLGAKLTQTSNLQRLGDAEAEHPVVADARQAYEEFAVRIGDGKNKEFWKFVGTLLGAGTELVLNVAAVRGGAGPAARGLSRAGMMRPRPPGGRQPHLPAEIERIQRLANIPSIARILNLGASPGARGVALTEEEALAASE